MAPPRPVTRSIKLKLVLPRSGSPIPETLWSTHELINRAIAYYEWHLLLMRGGSYETRGSRVEEGAVVGELLATARRAQEANGGTSGSDEEIIDLLRGLYTDIVPSAVGEEGTAQTANAFLGPLTDPESRGLLDIFDKLEAPEWVEAARRKDPEGTARAIAWLSSEAGQKRLRATGSPTTWMRLARADPTNPAWVEAFLADYERKLREVQGAPDRVRRLKALGVLPLFEPYIAPRLANRGGVVSRWDRMAFRSAVGHLLPWESWCHRAARDHAARRDRLERLQGSPEVRRLAGKIDALRVYEVERQRRRAEDPLALPSDRPVRITPRMARGWDDLRKRWLKSADRSQEALLIISAERQTKLRGGFGDPDLCRWLAQPENHGIWSSRGDDAVGILARLNAIQAEVERSREAALMTLPDAVQHPRSVQWEAEGGTNFKSYALRVRPGGRLEARLPVLRLIGEDRYEDTVLDRWLPLAASDQLQEVQLDQLEKSEGGRNKQVRVAYATNNGERLHGRLGSADLLMEWFYLRNRPSERVASGDIGPAWLKLAIDIERVLPDGSDGRRPPALAHFRTATGKKTRTEAEVRPGVRVLSVDLGVRAFAACSVFELRTERPAAGLAFPVEDLGLWAAHERSFTLYLPGEQAERRAERWREAQEEELRTLRRALDRCRRVYRLLGLEPPDRHDPLDVLDEAIRTDGARLPFEDRLRAELANHVGAPQPVWDEIVRDVFRRWRGELGGIIGAWRRCTRAPHAGKLSGKSVWAIEHLTRVRRLLQSWSLLGRASGDVRRLDRERQGVFAAHLLAHLDGLKEDRRKTGADLIVQAARGYLRDRSGRWVQSYAPCPIIVFEDLSRYRMQTDRPRRENSQLMRWAHRAVPQEVAIQGELYGLHTTDVAAAFSSRYHAATGVPGIRCVSLSKEDLADPFFHDLLLRENPGLDLGACRPGDFVPLSGGAMFVCKRRGGGITTVQADINAAQNLQRRFWTRHGEPFRLPALRVMADGQEQWVPKHLGERLRGALGGYGCLEPTGHDSGSCRWRNLSKKRWEHLVGASASPEATDEEPDKQSQDGAQSREARMAEQELAGLEEEVLERSGTLVVFFRDPSGIVLPVDLWFPAREFWSRVKASVLAELRGRA